MKYAWKAQEVVNGWNGKAIRIPRSKDPNDDTAGIITADAIVMDVFQIITTNASYKTIDDSKEGRRMAEAIEAAIKSEVIELDQGTHNWLKKQTEVLAPQIFRINGEIIDDLVKDGWKRENGSSQAA